MSCGVGHRCRSDLVLLWLWCRLAAVALIRFLDWEPPFATAVALKKKKKKKSKLMLGCLSSWGSERHPSQLREDKDKDRYHMGTRERQRPQVMV